MGELKTLTSFALGPRIPGNTWRTGLEMAPMVTAQYFLSVERRFFALHLVGTVLSPRGRDVDA